MSRYRSASDKYKIPNQPWVMGGYGFELRQDRIRDRVNRLNHGVITKATKPFDNLYRMISEKNSHQAGRLIELRSERNN